MLPVLCSHVAGLLQEPHASPRRHALGAERLRKVDSQEPFSDSAFR